MGVPEIISRRVGVAGVHRWDAGCRNVLMLKCGFCELHERLTEAGRWLKTQEVLQRRALWSHSCFAQEIWCFAGFLREAQARGHVDAPLPMRAARSVERLVHRLVL